MFAFVQYPVVEIYFSAVFLNFMDPTIQNKILIWQ